MGLLEVVRRSFTNGTTANNPERSGIDVVPGTVIDSIGLHVPFNHDGFVPVWIELDRELLVPTGQGGEIEFRLNEIHQPIEILGHPFLVQRTGRLELVGYNEHPDGLPHTTTTIIRGRYAEEV